MTRPSIPRHPVFAGEIAFAFEIWFLHYCLMLHIDCTFSRFCDVPFVFRRVCTTIFVLSWVQSHSSGSCHEAWLLSFRMLSVIHRGLRLRTNLVA